LIPQGGEFATALEMGSPSPIHIQNLSGHVGGVQKEEFYRASDVSRGSRAFKQGMVDDAVLFYQGKALAFGPGNRARSNRIDTHIRPKLKGQGASKP
jgi:hypothetical protein